MDQDPGDAERARLVALFRERPHGTAWSQLTTEIVEHGSVGAVWREHFPDDLFGTSEQTPAIREAERDIAAWRSAGMGLLTLLDDDYPPQLREIHELPPVLFHRGKLVEADFGISVVGSRAASARGLDIATTVASDLVSRGLTVVSGLAKGIDTAAHTAALEAGGRTVAVIGTGINGYYPAENRALQDRIAAEGLLLSQFWPDAPPRPQQFPMRNAVMSGYSRATIVVEAGEKSGARIQARQAVGHGRPVILTDLVVEANAWARKLVAHPGVQVASSTREVMSYVEAIATAADEINQMLSVARE